MFNHQSFQKNYQELISGIRIESYMRNKKNFKAVNNTRNALSITYITEDTKIKADMHCNEDVRIAGFVEGEVESKQKLILSKSGTVEGSITSPEADLSGKIKGTVRVSDKLTLRSTAVIEGGIWAKKLTIEDGAQVSGALNVGPEIDVKMNGISNNIAPPLPIKDKST